MFSAASLSSFLAGLYFICQTSAVAITTTSAATATPTETNTWTVSKYECPAGSPNGCAYSFDVQGNSGPDGSAFTASCFGTDTYPEQGFVACTPGQGAPATGTIKSSVHGDKNKVATQVVEITFGVVRDCKTYTYTAEHDISIGNGPIATSWTMQPQMTVGDVAECMTANV